MSLSPGLTLQAEDVVDVRHLVFNTKGTEQNYQDAEGGDPHEFMASATHQTAQQLDSVHPRLNK